MERLRSCCGKAVTQVKYLDMCICNYTATIHAAKERRGTESTSMATIVRSLAIHDQGERPIFPYYCGIFTITHQRALPTVRARKI